MAQLWRVSFRLSGKQQGWVESIIFPRDNVDAETLYNQTILNIAQKRAACLGAQFQMDEVRISLIRDTLGNKVVRNARLFKTFIPASQDPTNTAEKVNLAVLVTARDSTLKLSRKMYMRGIPDQISTNGGELDPNGASGWGSRYNAWAAAVQAAQGGWLGRAVSKSNVKLDTYVINVDGTVSLTFATDIVELANVGVVQTISMKGINGGNSRLNGSLVVNPDSQIKVTTEKAIAVFPYTFGGRGTSYVQPYGFITAAQWTAQGISHHDTGRPTSAARGRQRAQAKG